MRFHHTVSILAIACTLTACGGSSSSSGTTTPTPTNTAPVVEAGTAQMAVEGSTVQLAATASDANGDTLTYTWSQTSGPDITLSSTTIEDPTFTAPEITATEADVVLSLSVSDGSATTTDSVTITITDATTDTTGKSQVQAPGRTATLTVNAAAEDTILWTQTAGTTVTLSDASIAAPTFTVPSATASETLVFSVTLNGTDTSEVKVYVYVPPAYSASQTEVGDFTDEAEWVCDQSAGIASVTVSDSSAFKTISGNGIPNHAVGTFPNGGNPNTITEQTISYEIPGTPVLTTSATDMQEFGLFLNGVRLVRDTAERYSGTGGGDWSYEAITAGVEQGNSKGDDTQQAIQNDWLGTDCNNAHVQPTGSYHNHGFPEAYFQELTSFETPTDMVLAGYAADGFPMYLRYGYTDASDSTSALKVIEHSWELISGTRASGPGGAYDGTFRQDWEYAAGTGDTDQCGGRTGPTPEYPDGTYHYYITDDYPFIPRCVFGTPSSSFRSLGGGP